MKERLEAPMIERLVHRLLKAATAVAARACLAVRDEWQRVDLERQGFYKCPLCSYLHFTGDTLCRDQYNAATSTSPSSTKATHHP